MSSSTSTSEREVRKRLILDLGAVLAVVVVTHLVVSALVVAYMSHAHAHRMVNLQSWKNTGSTWEAVASTFARQAQSQAATDGKRSLVVIGSSVSYGFPYGRQTPFSQTVAQVLPQYSVANLSAVGVGMDAITDFVTCYLGVEFRPDLLIAEIPLVNTTSSISTGQTADKRECMHPPSVSFGFWGLVLPRFHGVAWMAVLWEEVIAFRPTQPILVRPVPEDYFASASRFALIEPQYRQVLSRYLDDVSSMGKTVLVFVSPVYLPAVRAGGGDADAVAHQTRLTLDVCRMHGRVKCLEVPSSLMREDFFYNMTHFNPLGSHAFGEWVAERVAELP